LDKGQLYPHLQKDFSGLKHLPQFQELFLTLEEVQLLLHQDLGRLKLRPQEASLERLLQKLILCSETLRPLHKHSDKQHQVAFLVLLEYLDNLLLLSQDLNLILIFLELNPSQHQA